MKSVLMVVGMLAAAGLMVCSIIAMNAMDPAGVWIMAEAFAVGLALFGVFFMIAITDR